MADPPYIRRHVSDLKLGDVAPDFELPDERGVAFRLTEALRSGPVVLFFYPKDETALCTKEACGFRDEYPSFAAEGVQIVGISRDSVESHAAFVAHHALPYRLLSDAEGRIAALFGVKRILGLLAGRATFIVDSERRIRLCFHSVHSASAHIESARRAIGEMNQSSLV
jgi:peroxiredoxin Q/BCP